jgi:hypothetical protein
MKAVKTGVSFKAIIPDRQGSGAVPVADPVRCMPEFVTISLEKPVQVAWLLPGSPEYGRGMMRLIKIFIYNILEENNPDCACFVPATLAACVDSGGWGLHPIGTVYLMGIRQYVLYSFICLISLLERVNIIYISGVSG